MILTLVLAGFYALLWVPYLGGLLMHGILHVTAEILHHHEHAFAATLIVVFWLLVIALPAFTLLGLWGPATDAGLLFLILFQILGGMEEVLYGLKERRKNKKGVH